MTVDQQASWKRNNAKDVHGITAGGKESAAGVGEGEGDNRKRDQNDPPSRTLTWAAE